MEATWVGGPWDGRTDELPVYARQVAVACKHEDTYRELVLPVVHTVGGARIYWHEPS